MSAKIIQALIAFVLIGPPVLGQTPSLYPAQPYAVPIVYETTAPAPEMTEPFPTGMLYAAVSAERWWVSAGYLMGFVQPAHAPPLVTTSPVGTPQATAGVLAPSSSVLFGDRGVDSGFQSGFRFGGGCWFDDDRTLGCDAGMFWLQGVQQSFSASSDGSTILARPFTDASSGAQSSLLVAFPSGSGPTGAMSSGSVAVSANAGQFYGAHFDLQESIINDPGFRLKSLLGYRYLHFSDSLQIQQTMNPTGGSPNPPPGTQITSQDNFSAGNNFNGGELGLQAEIIRGRWSLGFLGKVALGSVQRQVSINGNTVVTATNTAPVNSSGGLLALSTNSGNYSDNSFAVVPEFGLNLGWQVTNNLRLSAGYSILVLNNAVRAAEQIDTTVNSSLLNSSLVSQSNSSSVQRPAFSFENNSIWLQTINVALEFRY